MAFSGWETEVSEDPSIYISFPSPTFVEKRAQLGKPCLFFSRSFSNSISPHFPLCVTDVQSISPFFLDPPQVNPFHSTTPPPTDSHPPFRDICCGFLLLAEHELSPFSFEVLPIFPHSPPPPTKGGPYLPNPPTLPPAFLILPQASKRVLPYHSLTLTIVHGTKPRPLNDFPLRLTFVKFVVQYFLLPSFFPPPLSQSFLLLQSAQLSSPTVIPPFIISQHLQLSFSFFTPRTASPIYDQRIGSPS